MFFCVLGRRNALRASEAVRATGVMVNPADWQVQKKSPVGLFCNATRKLLLLRIHFLDMIVHNRSELHWRLDVWNWSVGSASAFNHDRPIVKDSSQYPLMYAKAFNFINTEFHRIASDQTHFCDDSLVS